MYFITIDAGTTNSRIYLMDQETNEVVDQVKRKIGIRNVAIDQSTKNFQNALSLAIEEMFVNNHIQHHQISFIVASGMITSNLGLVEVPYVINPSTINNFATASVIRKIPEFYDLPCIFIPGAKNRVNTHIDQEIYKEIHTYDVMRGEEVEVFGLIDQLHLTGKGMFILPGSHMKYVLVENDKILSSLSTLSGEILYAIQKETILTNSLHEDLLKEINVDVLLQGFQAGRSYGLSRTLYQIRLSQLFDRLGENERANYYVGSVLADDLKALKETYHLETLDWIVVGGNNPLRKSMIHILKHLKYERVIEANDAQMFMSTIIGSKKIGQLSMEQFECK